MIRRNTRLRKEYIYRKALEAKDRQIFERKQALKNALAGQFYIYIYLFFFGFTKFSQYLLQI